MSDLCDVTKVIAISVQFHCKVRSVMYDFRHVYIIDKLKKNKKKTLDGIRNFTGDTVFNGILHLEAL